MKEQKCHQGTSPWDVLLGEEARSAFREEDPAFVWCHLHGWGQTELESRSGDYLIQYLPLGLPSLRTVVLGDIRWLGSSQGD